MENGPHAAHAAPDESPVEDRADIGRARSLQNVEAHHVMVQVSQGADQGLAEMSSASCDQGSQSRASASRVREINTQNMSGAPRRPTSSLVNPQEPDPAFAGTCP
jgi:hypothetical protein